MSDTTNSGPRLTSTRPQMRGRLFLKYVALVVSVVCVALLANGLFGIWLSYRDQKASLVGLQSEKAALAAVQIGQFVKNIEEQLGWITQIPGPALTLAERRIDALRLLRQAPAIAELAWVDEKGREQVRVSRTTTDVIGSARDLSDNPEVIEALARSVYYGAVYFRRGSEPYFTLALAGPHRESGIAVAEVNLVYVWDIVSQIRIGERGKAYVIDSGGRLIAHPDISLVLRNSDLSHLVQVKRARGELDVPGERSQIVRDIEGREVLTAYARVPPLGWLVFVDSPISEAYAPVYASLLATALVLLGGLVLAVIASLILARKMITPIQALQQGAARIGSGALDYRIQIRTGDELEALGDQFNSMALQLQDSYATLERKVEERTHQLQLANLAKSRFLAAASHDLRQPLHALNLFVAQLRSEMRQAEGTPLISRIEAAVGAMNELFDALLDISKLDAGVLEPNIRDIPVDHILKRIETTFAAAAREKGLRLRVVPSTFSVSSDFILLERILLNLVSNAVRYSNRGGVVVGCRRRGDRMRIEVWDTGSGIPADQQRNIFGEFYQLGNSAGDRGPGLGLGLAIVDRLCNLLDHPIEITSRVDTGSRFSISLPLAFSSPQQVARPAIAKTMADPVSGRLILVIDDDALVLEAMGGLLKSWGCDVITVSSTREALAARAAHARLPDLIISDYRLADGTTGFDAISELRKAIGAAVPAFLISGDTAPERLQEATVSGYQLLHKPVMPITLRALLAQLLKENHSGVPGRSTESRSSTALRCAAIPTPAFPPQ